MNLYESGGRKVIPAVLVYGHRDGQRLMISRDAREGDHHAGKWNGLGGKCEPDESPLEAAIREFKEESGLALDPGAFKALGVLQFPNFKPAKHEDWMVFVFSAEIPAGALANVDSDEGSLHWVPQGDLLKLNLWAGDRLFIHWVMQDKPFVGTIWYKGDEVIRDWIVPLN